MLAKETEKNLETILNASLRHDCNSSLSAIFTAGVAKHYKERLAKIVQVMEITVTSSCRQYCDNNSLDKITHFWHLCSPHVVDQNLNKTRAVLRNCNRTKVLQATAYKNRQCSKAKDKNRQCSKAKDTHADTAPAHQPSLCINTRGYFQQHAGCQVIVM